MTGILERNFMKVWLAAAGMIGYNLVTDARALAIERKDTKPGQLTVIYRRRFCPIGRVERHQGTDKLGQSANDWHADQYDYYKIAADWKWVIPSPTGAHQIIYSNPDGKQLLGYYSRVWQVVIFPFRQISKS